MGNVYFSHEEKKQSTEAQKKVYVQETKLAVFFSGFSHRSKGMYLVAKPKNEDHV